MNSPLCCAIHSQHSADFAGRLRKYDKVRIISVFQHRGTFIHAIIPTELLARLYINAFSLSKRVIIIKTIPVTQGKRLFRSGILLIFILA